MSKRLIFALLLCLVSRPVFAACTGSSPTWTCATWADLETLVEGASLVNGDTVNVSAGALTGDTLIVVPAAKRITLTGAGAGSTVVTMSGSGELDLGTSDSSVSGFTFQASTSIGTYLSADGDGAVGRIHHNAFINTYTSNQRCVYLEGGSSRPHPVYLVDNNTFQNCRVSLAGDVSMSFGEQYWESPGDGFGPVRSSVTQFSQCVYVEENAFTYTQGGNAVETDYGGCMVVRFNTFNGSGEAHQHGTGVLATEHPPGRVLEFYHNDCQLEGTNNSCAWFRSGTGVILGNSVHSSYGSPFQFDVQGRSMAGGTCATTSSGCADGLQPEDGNVGSGSAYPGDGWPLFSQPGYGAYSGEYTPGTYPGQTAMPIPIVLNRQSGAAPSLTFSSAGFSSAMHISNGREVQNEVATASFDGTIGTSYGTAAQFATEGTCEGNAGGIAGNGVYFWVTDEGSWNAGSNAFYTGQGRLYKCSADNTWTLWWVPYTFPHPLQGEGGADATNPVVAITSPNSGDNFNTSTNPQTVSGTCSDNVAVSSVSLSNAAGGSPSCTGTTSWSCEVPMTAGANALTVTCTDTSTNTHQDTVTATYTAPGASGRPSIIRRLRAADLTGPAVGLWIAALMWRRYALRARGRS
jgi:hypothetical protein